MILWLELRLSETSEGWLQGSNYNHVLEELQKTAESEAKKWI